MAKNIVVGDGTERLLVRPVWTLTRPPIPHSAEAYGLCPIRDSSTSRWNCSKANDQPDYNCADWTTGLPANFTLMTDDEDADYKPNCIFQNTNRMVGSAWATGLLVPTQTALPNLGTADFSIEMWMCELQPSTWFNNAAWTPALGYIDPPFNALDDPAGFVRRVPYVYAGWTSGTVQELFFGLVYHGTDLYLCFSEDDSVGGLQSFWGAAVTRPAPGTWNHYALVCDRSNNASYLYIDGNLITTLNIAGHRNSNVLNAPHVAEVDYSTLSTYLNAPDRGAYTTAASYPQFKHNLHTFHYEALTATEIKNSFLGRTTQNKASTYFRYDWRNMLKHSYQSRLGNARWRRYVYRPYAGGLPAGWTPDSYWDTAMWTRDTLGEVRPWACKEVRDLGVISWVTCCDTSLWGAGQGHAHLEGSWANPSAWDQDPFWSL